MLACDPSREGLPIGTLRRVAAVLLIASVASLSGCLWIPGLFKEKADPPPPTPDNRPLSHCRPHTGEPRPVLLGQQTGERTFQCRIKDVAQAEWRVSFSDPIQARLPSLAVSPFILGQGVDEVRLAVDDLPISPAPYEALLELRLREDGSSQTWRLIVIPHPDAAFPEPDPLEVDET